MALFQFVLCRTLNVGFYQNHLIGSDHRSNQHIYKYCYGCYIKHSHNHITDQKCELIVKRVNGGRFVVANKENGPEHRPKC